MKTFILILLVLVPTFARGEPTIVFQSEKHDFGSVKKGEPLEYTFEFRNAGSDDLIIEQFNTG